MGIFRQFPYSNFHEFNLDQIIKIMREMQDEWDATKTEWASYKDFIDNYFANLDVSEEVLEALRVMADDGTLNQIIDPVIASEVAEWLTENITPTTPPVDASLTVSGAAADAKVAGIRIGNDDRAIIKISDILNDKIGSVPFIMQNNKVINNTGAIIDSNNFACIITPIPNNSILTVSDALDIRNTYYDAAGNMIAQGAVVALTAGQSTNLYSSNPSVAYVLVAVRNTNGSNPPDADAFSKIITITRPTVTENVDISGNSITWEYGKINDDGSEVSATEGIRTIDTINTDIEVTADTGISFRAVFKKVDGTFVGSSVFTGAHTFDINRDYDWLRLTARYTDNTPIADINDILDHISVKALNNYTYRGRVTDNSRTSFAACVNSGYYGFASTDLSSLTDAPVTLNYGGVLRVERDCATDQIFQTIVDILGQSWFRYGSNPWARISGTDVTWYALGDSITQGYTSESGQIGPVTSNNWVTNVARLNGYNFTNYGEGGSGYLHPGTVGTQQNAKGHVDDIDFSDCDLVTLSYGVNDWHYNMVIGSVSDNKDAGNSMCANMKYCIEKILDDNPLCKIIVLTPFNCSAYGGTFATNWGLGTSLQTSGTLQDVIDTIISVCEYYGIEYIDQSTNSIVSRSNINDVLSDGIHPIAELYPALGKDLASKINMK